MSSSARPTQQQIEQAAARIAPYVHRTPVLQSRNLDELSGCTLFFKCENFQKAGAFKSRGAVNAVFSLDEQQRKQGVATHSSGNHAAALARAAALRNAKAYVVMPDNSSVVKIAAVKHYGGLVTFCSPTLASRESTLKEVIEKTHAIEIHPYNNTTIIAGQATATKELIEEVPNLDLLIVPVGGGGLLSGSALAAHYFASNLTVIAAEPEQADDAYQSFVQKKFVPSVHPDTIADGLRTSLGDITFPIILDHVEQVVTVSEKSIVAAMRLVWERMKIIIEPSSAVPLAALLEKKINSRYQRVGIIISGGNVDLDHLPWISS
jgi:threonine dehydratase